MNDLIEKFKNWALGVGAAVVAVLIALFFYEKNKAQVDDALVKQQKVDNDLQQDQSIIDRNNAALKAEEQKRQALEKEPVNDPSDQNIIDLFNNRK